MATPRVWLGLGTNLGDRIENLRAALRALAGIGEIDRVSSVYESEPVGYREQPDFWNLVVVLETDLGPEELLTAIEEIEERIGREPSFRNAPRPIDIDILLYGTESLESPALTIPHPRLTERAFVLRPLLELEQELTHPVSGVPLRHFLESPEMERAEILFSGEGLIG